MNAYDIIRKPVVTENSMADMANKKYTFIVDIHANKTQIKLAIEEVFGVKVEQVNTLRVLGKIKRQGQHEGKRPDFKKAIVQLKPDSKTIEFFEGL